LATSLDSALGAFGDRDYSVQVCRTLFGIVPGIPPFELYPDVAGAGRRVGVVVDDGLRARLAVSAGGDAVQRSLWVADALDNADVGLVAYSGMTSLFRLLAGGASPSRRVFESDTQQAIDSVLKALGLSYMVSLLFPGAPPEKASRFLNIPAGREALTYYAVAEVALPFTDNLVEGGLAVFARLMGAASAAGTARFAQMVGPEDARRAEGMLGQLQGAIGQLLDQAGGVLGPVSQKLRAFVPTVLAATDSLAGALAGGLDALPVWRFLGARLAAEAVLLGTRGERPPAATEPGSLAT
jgi:hypothetical protein